MKQQKTDTCKTNAKERLRNNSKQNLASSREGDVSRTRNGGINLSSRNLKELIYIDKKVFAADCNQKISNLNSPKDSKQQAKQRETQRSALNYSSKL